MYDCEWEYYHESITGISKALNKTNKKEYQQYNFTERNVETR